MKKYLLAIAAVALVMSGCTDQQFLDETADLTRASAQVSEIEMLKEQARWGDGQAYLKLADCYRDGKGVEKNFISMLSMVALADQYGGIKRMEDYLEAMPSNSEFKLIFDAVDLYEKKQLVKVRERRIPLEEFYEMCNEHEEMNLQSYMFDMWERFTFDFYGFASGLKDAEIFIQ